MSKMPAREEEAPEEAPEEEAPEEEAPEEAAPTEDGPEDGPEEAAPGEAAPYIVQRQETGKMSPTDRAEIAEVPRRLRTTRRSTAVQAMSMSTTT